MFSVGQTMVNRYIGSCGETSERTAARIHSWAAVVMGICVVAEAAALGLHLLMGGWHWASNGVHAQRAEDRGE